MAKTNKLESRQSTQCVDNVFHYSYLFPQLCPFPFDYIKEDTERYHNAQITWAQEEPKNMGYWSYVKPRIETATGQSKRVR